MPAHYCAPSHANNKSISPISSDTHLIYSRGRPEAGRTCRISVLLVLTVVALFAPYTHATVCPETDYELTTQSQVDEFPASCDSVEGYLWIRGVETTFDSQRITSLAALENLSSVGTLHITDTILEDLSGLEGLSNITDGNRPNKFPLGQQMLSIQNNANLVNLRGLDGLTHIGGGVGARGSTHISENPNLETLAGLDSLRVDNSEYLYIGSNDSLTSLDGLQNLESVQKLQVGDNDSLTTLADFDSLRSIKELLITGNDSLTTLSGLEGVVPEYSVEIILNPVLQSLQPLSGIKRLRERLWIRGNYVLESLDGLENLKRAGYVLLYDNGPAAHDSAFYGALSALESVYYFKSDDSPESLTPLAGLLGWPDLSGESSRVEIIDLQRAEVPQVLALVDHNALTEIIDVTQQNEGVVFELAPTEGSELFPLEGYEVQCGGRTVVAEAYPNITVADLSTIQSKISISESIGLENSSIRIALAIDHPYSTDLQVTLTSPNGQSVTVWNNDNLPLGLISSDIESAKIFPDDRMPAEPFHIFDSGTSQGDWTLSITDSKEDNQGLLIYWVIEIVELHKNTSTESSVLLDSLENGVEYSCRGAAVTKMAHDPLSDAVSVIPEATMEDKIQERFGDLLRSITFRSGK